MTPQTYRLTISYDGTAYAGWQVQPDQLSVQQVLEETLNRILQKSTRIHSSGRTDRGVHARAQTAHIQLHQAMSPSVLQRALNALLPPDIRVSAVLNVSPDFHARFSALSKEYRYYIWNGPVLSPFDVRYRLHVRRSLDLPAMREAAEVLVGEHDFASFTANPNRILETTVRHLKRLEIHQTGDEIMISAVGNGFLYKMVRSLVGGLLRVGYGELSPADIQRILKEKKRTAEIPTARAHGLFLWKVDY